MESSVGAPIITSNPLVQPSGVSATSSVGSVVTEIGVPLTGVSATSSDGSVTISTFTEVSLTGLSATSSVGEAYAVHYADIDTGSNSSYSNVATGSNTGYTDVTGKEVA